MKNRTEEGSSVGEFGFLERRVRRSECSGRDRLQTESSDGKNASRFVVIGISSERDLESGKGGCAGDVEFRRAMKGEEERFERGKVDRADLSIEETHRRFERSSRNVIRCKGRIPHPEFRLVNTGNDRAREILLRRLRIFVLVLLLSFLLRFWYEIPCVLRLLCSRGTLHREPISTSPLVQSAITSFSVRVFELRRFSTRSSCQRTIEERLGHSDGRPVGLESSGNDFWRFESRSTDGREEMDDVLLVQSSASEYVLGEFDQSVAFRREVSESICIEIVSFRSRRAG